MKLPDSVQEIADVIGSERALLLVGKLPRAYRKDGRGSTLIMYVPTAARLGLSHELVRILGWNDALKLCKAFGGEIMYPANCACVERKFRDQAILQMVSEGLRKSVVAEQIGISERQVRNVVNAFGQLSAIPPEERKDAANDNASVQTNRAHINVPGRN